ncbi:hypothetical protein KGF57_000836 [Candida theae]|uniref:Alpha-1,2-mannosyltransferase n=1 Tax=Candida theae TaxID=1198502 RepID=A0AAD5BI29_9ASCO|nr:uncharacterized protein KGF57_000836 [Candida theae]KAI5965043.1 hypothetical protein KGF57_000836 [Candida theae]
MFFRRLSLSYVFLGALVVAVIIFNVSILSSSDSVTTAAAISNSRTGGAKYFTGGKSSLQAHVNKVDSQEYIDEVMQELENTKKEEILAELKQSVAKSEKPKIVQELKNELRQKYLDVIQQTLKDEVKEEQTGEFFKQNSVSYALFEQLVNTYAKEHKSDFKPAAFLEILKNEVHDFPSDFELKVTKASERFFDKSSFFKHLIKNVLVANKPNCEAFTDEERGKKLNPTYQKDQRIISEKYLRESNLKIPIPKFKCLQESHDNVVKTLKSLPDPPKQFVSGYGIVINGGGGMIASALTAITNLRDRGSSLPVELILDTPEEYDKQICEDLLPNKLNGKCVVIQNILGKEVFDLVSEKFARKILGLIVSSFDHTIALDADNFPIRDVDNLLYTEPYLSTKMILWPDLWVKLTSPLYYKIARIEKGEPIHRFGLANDAKFLDYIQKDKASEIHFHDFANLPSTISVETGQMVFSKREHFRALLLSLYYNMNSKGWYETLLYQGAFGEGDRETIVPALHVMNERYHLTNQKLYLWGYTADNGKFSETTLGQTDPRDNPEFYHDWQKFLSTKQLDTRLNPFQSGGYTDRLIEQFKEYKKKIIEDKKIEDEDTAHRLVEYQLPKLLFLHCNHPKIDPVKNAQEGEFGTYSRRNIGPMDDIKSVFGKRDWELRFHSIAKWVACDAIKSPEYWKNTAKIDQQTVCFKLDKYIEFLKSDSFDSTFEFKSEDVEKFYTGAKGAANGAAAVKGANGGTEDEIKAIAAQQAQQQAEAEANAKAKGEVDDPLKEDVKDGGAAAKPKEVEVNHPQ